eukprot:TRINITY_DN20212_c0_g1_i1.p1 TRINITY_DN20212_c0_g1~~TRINITY_DN20212_c0_g1_i1.p1  ORF type:complete len:142 (+),score=13.35 TRINITY_DN20212_c0_g1_i1:172-597(+)
MSDALAKQPTPPPELKTDSWDSVEDQLKKGASLVVVAFVHMWSAPALHVVTSLNRIKPEASFAHIFIVNVDSEPVRSREFRLRSTPAVCFFFDGKPLTVRRPDWEDQRFFVGAMPEDNWLDLIRHARDAGERGKLIVYADF